MLGALHSRSSLTGLVRLLPAAVAIFACGVSHIRLLVNMTLRMCMNINNQLYIVCSFATGLVSLSRFTAGRSQPSVGAQGSTARVWGEQRQRPHRHEPHKGWPGHFHRQLAPLQPRAGEEDRRVSAAVAETQLAVLEWTTLALGRVRMTEASTCAQCSSGARSHFLVCRGSFI